ncbi:uncharacterized protein VTP21DRAFT_4897 [Calcarisporiella thermophila]|uniref:uncharacterized protein n=1 Tax=Calcarisporiella thermophila TaxID=911321 RepID=UPI0037436175
MSLNQSFQRWHTLATPLGADLAPLLQVMALNSSNSPELASKIVETRLNEIESEEDKVLFLTRVREAVLKGMLLSGVPRVINTLSHISGVVDPSLMEKLPKESTKKITSMEDFARIHARGDSFFDKVYGSQATKVREVLRGYNPDLMDFVQDSYGRYLSDERLLSSVETELCVIAALVPMGVEPQLKSHCIGAMNVGATKEQVETVLSLAKAVLQDVQERRQ